MEILFLALGIAVGYLVGRSGWAPLPPPSARVILSLAVLATVVVGTAFLAPRVGADPKGLELLIGLAFAVVLAGAVLRSALTQPRSP